MLSSSVSSLYFISLLVTQLTSTAILSPQPPLTFQVDPSNIPPPADQSSFESWSGDIVNSQFHNTDSQAPTEPLLSRPEENKFLFESVPANLYNRFSPIPVPLPFFSLFQGLLNRLSFFGFPSSFFHHHHHIGQPIDLTQYTIGEVLNWTLHHTPKPSSLGHDNPPPLHRLAWLVNLSHPIQELLYNPDADLTLFAPDDKALTPPSKKRHHFQQGQMMNSPFEPVAIDEASHGEATHVFWDAVQAIETYTECPHHTRPDSVWAQVDDGEKEKKKKFFLHVIESVLKYHVSPGSKKVHEIIDRSTLATELPILPYSRAAKFRLRVGPTLPHLTKPGQVVLNFFTKLDLFKYRPLLTKNGVIYIAGTAPLLPPLSPLSELFLFPRPFSTLTSAIQKTHLDHLLLPTWENKTIPFSLDHNRSLDSSSEFDESLKTVDERVQSVLASLTDGHEGKLVKRSFTIFAPTNHAFRSLGPAANAFLFSPFGQHILRHVLSYHIVPHYIWNTDHCDQTKNDKTLSCDLNSHTLHTVEFPVPQYFGPPGRFSGLDSHHPFPPLPGKVNITELTLPTVLGSRKNESIPISLVEFRHLGKGPIIRRVYIHQNQQKFAFGPPNKNAIPVVVADGVAWGGAIHLVPKLLRPPVPEGHHQRKDVQRALELSILSPA